MATNGWLMVRSGREEWARRGLFKYAMTRISVFDGLVTLAFEDTLGRSAGRLRLPNNIADTFCGCISSVGFRCADCVFVAGMHGHAAYLCRAVYLFSEYLSWYDLSKIFVQEVRKMVSCHCVLEMWCV
jgi:hypothetical protein